MITGVIARQFERFRDRLARLLLRTRVRPNTLTIIGLGLNIPVSVLIGNGYLRWGAVLFLIASLFDVLDGAVAKGGNRITRFGGFFDSTMDRISDMFLFGGVAWFMFVKDEAPGSRAFGFLALVALGFSLLISYTRARAECIIPSCQVGFAERAERIIILIAACFLRSLRPAIGLLVLLTGLTFVHRVLYTWYQTNDRPFPNGLRVMFLHFPRGSLGYDLVFLVIAVFLFAGAHW